MNSPARELLPLARLRDVRDFGLPQLVPAGDPLTRAEEAAVVEAAQKSLIEFKRRGFAIDIQGPFHSHAVIRRLVKRGFLYTVGEHSWVPTRASVTIDGTIRAMKIVRRQRERSW